MTTLILDGYIVKEKTDNGKMFYFSDKPEETGDSEFSVGNQGDNCFSIDAPIRDFVQVNEPVKCKITIELAK